MWSTVRRGEASRRRGASVRLRVSRLCPAYAPAFGCWLEDVFQGLEEPEHAVRLAFFSTLLQRGRESGEDCELTLVGQCRLRPPRALQEVEGDCGLVGEQAQ